MESQEIKRPKDKKREDGDQVADKGTRKPDNGKKHKVPEATSTVSKILSQDALDDERQDNDFEFDELDKNSKKIISEADGASQKTGKKPLQKRLKPKEDQKPVNQNEVPANPRIEVPVNVPPLNAPPANVPPLNAPPANVNPVNVPPVNVPPVNVNPVNAPPVNVNPVNVNPVNDLPVNVNPANVNPVNDPPVNDLPVNDPPVNDLPVNDPPILFKNNPKKWFVQNPTISIRCVLATSLIQIAANMCLGYFFEPCWKATLGATCINSLYCCMTIYLFETSRATIISDEIPIGLVVACAVCFVMSFGKKCEFKKKPTIVKRDLQLACTASNEWKMWITITIMACILITSIGYLLSRRKRRPLLSQEA